MQLNRAKLWAPALFIIGISGILLSPMALPFAKANRLLTPTPDLPQLPSNSAAITAANAQRLTEIARLCAINADDCGSPVAWSPDSRLLAIGSTTGVDLLDMRYLNQAPKHIPLPKRRFELFSPDWSLIAIINMDWSVSGWDVETVQKKLTVPLPNLNIGALEFSPNGQFLALAVGDYSVRLRM